MITRILTIVAFAALLTGCSRESDLSMLGTQTLKITTFSGGRETGVRSVSPAQILELAPADLLQSWIHRHQPATFEQSSR